MGTAGNSANSADNNQLQELQSRFSLISINSPEHNSQTQPGFSGLSNRQPAGLFILEFPTASTFSSQPLLEFRTTEKIRSSSSESEIVPIPGTIGTPKSKTLVTFSDKFHDRSTKSSACFQEVALRLQNLRTTFSIPTCPIFLHFRGLYEPKNPCSEDANKFLAQYDRCAVASSWEDNLKTTYFGSFLSGVANRWYEEFVAGNPDSRYLGRYCRRIQI